MKWVAKLPFVRYLRRAHPPYHVGGILANRFGLQVGRALAHRTGYFLRGPRRVPEAEDLAARFLADGVLEIRDFLPEDSAAALRTALEDVMDAVPWTSYKGPERGALEAIRVNLRAGEWKRAEVVSALADDPRVSGLARLATRRGVTSPRPTVGCFALRRPADSDAPDDIETVLHTDTYFPTVKAFYYPYAVSAQDGPFVYARGTHRLTPRRLRFEHVHAVRNARRRAGEAVPETWLKRRGASSRIGLAPDQERALGVEETVFEVPANTLILANTFGFHRREPIQAGRTRAVVLVNFRGCERGLLRRLAHRLDPVRRP